MHARIALALGTVYIVWGSTYLAIRWTVLEMPALAAGSLRFVVAGLGFLLLARATGPIALDRRALANAVLIGVLLPGVSNGLVGLAERDVPSAITALVLAIMPLWVGVLEAVRPGGARPAPLTVGGLLVGFGGTALVVWRGEGDAPVATAGVAMLLAAAFVWAAGSLYARGAARPRPWMAAAGVEMLAGGCLQGLLALLRGDFARLAAASPSPRALLSLLYLTVIGAWVGYGAFSWLVAHARPTLVATYAFVNPLVAVLLGWALAGEAFSSATLMGGALVVASVVLVTVPRR